MSSFFGKLAGRAMGTIPAVQPALAPLFAPGPALHGTLPTGMAEDVIPEAQPRLEREGYAVTTSPAAMQDAVLQAPTSADRMHIPYEQFKVQITGRFDRSASTPLLHATTVLGDLPPTLPAEESFAPAFTPVPSESNTLPGSIPDGEQGMLQPIVPLMWEPDPQMHATTSSPRRSSQEGPQAEPVPTIRISIGRIEVRAVHQAPPSAPQARPANRAPQPSLESYLQARNRGKP